MHLINELKLSGIIKKLYPVRKTLSGMGVATFVLEHESLQLESKQLVKCRIYCILLGQDVDLEQLVSSGNPVVIEGFIGQNAKSEIVFHVQQINF